MSKDPNNVLAMLWPWRNGDISDNPFVAEIS
jgi:hypothetical protein